MAKRRKRSLMLDRDIIVDTVLEDLKRDLDERLEWMNMRMDRYAKMRGWLPEVDWPWENCSNAWMPTMMIAALQMKSALFNAIMGVRPVVEPKAVQSVNAGREGRIARLLDYQVFVESSGAVRLDELISNFVDDGTAFAFTRWVKETNTIADVRVKDSFTDEEGNDLPVAEQAPALLEDIFGEELLAIDQRDDEGFSWTVSLEREKTARVEFYDQEDGRWSVHIQREAVTHDGPVFVPMDLEDVVAPVRSANLQPRTQANPHGALYVNRLCTITLNEIRQGRKSGIFDLISDEDMDAIENASMPHLGEKFEDKLKEEKDVQEGMAQQSAPKKDQVPEDGRPSNKGIDVVEHYGRWDVNGDGIDEDVIFWIARDSRVLMRARYLTEIYPGLPPERPFAEFKFIPVPNRLYAISLLELLEPIYDIQKTMLDQNIDWGTIRNLPFGFYRASSGVKPEPIRMWPGELYGVDDPQRDIHFPNMGNQSNAWIFNMLNFLEREEQRLSMVSDAQLGRVPQGKASALRTVGTTLALLQRGDTRTEQVLRRLLTGVSTIYKMFHRLNGRYLQPGKEFRIFGVPKPGEEAYLEVKSEDLGASMDFQFSATMVNTNKQAMRDALTQIAGILISPLALQMGLIGPEEIYRLFRDMVQAADVDPDKYLKPVSEQLRLPKIMAEEAISTILSGRVPEGLPLEGPEEHMKKLQEFRASDNFEMINTQTGVSIWEFYLRKIAQLMFEQRQSQQMAQSAGALQQQLGQAGGNGGQASMEAPPEANEPIEEGQQFNA